MSGKTKKNNFFRRISPGFLTRDTSAKLFFLGLSIFLWFLIKLSKDGYVTEIDYPVQYVNIPVDKKLTNVPPQKLKVTLRAKGFDVFKYKLRSLRPLRIDVSQLATSKSNRYAWSTNEQRKMVASQFGEEAQLIDIKPDTVYFLFDDLINKKVKVYLKLKKQLSNFRALYNAPVVQPDSILITGPPDKVNKIDSIFTKTVTVTGDKDSLVDNVKLDLPQDGDLNFSQKKVQVKFQFSSLTEGTLQIPVDIVNLPEQYKMVVYPAKVTVNYRVPLKDYDRVNDNDFHAYVNYSDLVGHDSDLVHFLPVSLKSYPTYIRQINIRPAKVEYILSKK